MVRAVRPVLPVVRGATIPFLAVLEGDDVDGVVDLLQVWLVLAGVAVVLLAAVVYTAFRLGWADSGAAEDEEPAASPGPAVS